MKQLITILVLFCPMLLMGQVKHEIKVDGFSVYHNFLFNKKLLLQASYEAILNKRIGLEAGLEYSWGITTLSKGFGASALWWKFDKEYIQFYVQGKYYFFPSTEGDRLWGGIYTFHQIETYKDSAFFDTATEYNIEGYKTIDKPYERLELGLSVGYKLLIKNHIIIEPVFGMGVDFSAYLLPPEYKDLDISGFYSLNIGYRF